MSTPKIGKAASGTSDVAGSGSDSKIHHTAQSAVTAAVTAERLASEGAHVIVADFDEAGATETAERIGGRAVHCDVTSRADVEAAVAAAVETGRLDVLVTCAGIIRDNLVHKMSDDDWEAVIATHLRGSFLAAQAAQAQMVGQRSGAMVLVSSMTKPST